MEEGSIEELELVCEQIVLELACGILFREVTAKFVARC